MAEHKSHEQIRLEISEAEKLIKVGSIYRHFKNGNEYKVICFAIGEENDELCVVYQNIVEADMIFIKSLTNWLSKPEVDGQKVERFQFVR